MTTWQEFEKRLTAISPVDKVLIDALVQLVSKRWDLKVFQKELAKRSGMSLAQVTSLELLETMPTLKLLSQYADGLGMKLELTVVPA